ncbi:DUF6599 family protein [candidate division KSB1 bacterium]
MRGCLPQRCGGQGRYDGRFGFTHLNQLKSFDFHMRTAATLSILVFLFLAANISASEPEPDYLLKLAPMLFPDKIEGTELLPGKVIRFYEPDNLYEYINGRASLYLSYGFLKLAHGEYRDKETGAGIILDIYDMGSLKAGFGIYSAERNPDLAFENLGTQGYFRENTCNLFQDRLYVRIEGENQGDNSTENLRRLARTVAHRLPPQKAWPDEIRLLPQESKLPNSEDYIPSSLLGYKFLGDGFSARYEIAGASEPARIFFTSKMGPDKARRTFQLLREAWGGPKMQPVDFLPEAETALAGQAPYLGQVIICLAAGRVCGLVDYQPGRPGQTAIKSLVVRLTR